MRVCNIKISIYFEEALFEKMKTKEKIHSCLASWKITQYRHSPHLMNVTGIRSESEINDVIIQLEEIYNNKCVKHQIDSVMLSHRDHKIIKLCNVYKHLKSVTDKYYIDYHPEIFTGMYLKPFNREYPTVNLFYTASFQLLGGKSFEKINYTVGMVKELINKCEN